MSRRKKRLIARNPLIRLGKAVFYYLVAVPVLFLITQLFLGLRVRGWRNIKALKGQGFVMACSHNHYFDCVAQGLLLCPRRGIYTSLEATFSWPVVGQLIRLLGAVPVPKNPGKMRGFFQEMAGAVRRGRIVLMYPEGELLPFCRHLREFHDGAFMIAAMAQAPVIPAVVTFRERKGLYRLLKRRPCITITAGAPGYPEHGESLRREAQRLGLAVRDAMEELMEAERPWDEPEHRGKTTSAFSGVSAAHPAFDPSADSLPAAEVLPEACPSE